jgi:hypothetical protein
VPARQLKVLCMPLLTIIIPISSLSGYTWNTGQSNSIRIAYALSGKSIGDGSYDAFLARAKRNKYNYVMGTFWLSPGDVSNYAVLKKDMKKAFQKADVYGLRLIPAFDIASAYSSHWAIAKAWNPNIKMLRVHLKTGGDTNASYGGPSFTYEPQGIDKTFPEALKAIREAYESAQTSYPFEFIQLGHDEPASYTYLLMGGCKIGRSSSLYCDYARQFEVDSIVEDECQADKDYILSYSDKSKAVQSLLVTEMYRRLNQVQAVFGSRVKPMFNADLWDVSVQRQTFYLWTGEAVKFSSGIAALPGLTSDSDKIKFRKNVIVCSWNYDKCAGVGGKPYSASAAFSNFASNGLKFVYWNAVGASSVIDTPLLRDFHSAAMNHKSHCLGYIGGSWDTYPHVSYKIQEALYKVNSAGLPKKDFQ